MRLLPRAEAAARKALNGSEMRCVIVGPSSRALEIAYRVFAGLHISFVQSQASAGGIYTDSEAMPRYRVCLSREGCMKSVDARYQRRWTWSDSKNLAGSFIATASLTLPEQSWTCDLSSTTAQYFHQETTIGFVNFNFLSRDCCTAAERIPRAATHCLQYQKLRETAGDSERT